MLTWGSTVLSVLPVISPSSKEVEYPSSPVKTPSCLRTLSQIHPYFFRSLHPPML